MFGGYEGGGSFTNYDKVTISRKRYEELLEAERKLKERNNGR